MSNPLRQRAGFVLTVLLACLASDGAGALNWWNPGKDKLSEQHGRYVLNRAFGDLYDTAFVLTNVARRAPRAVSVSELADALLGYDVVIFGELHGHPGIHLRELQLLRALHERDPRLVLSLEQFERDVQGVLDDYLAGRIGERTLMSKGRAWDNYPTSYRPLITYARQHDLPVVAAEAPEWSIRCIGRYGPDILDRFTTEERGWVARDLHAASAAYRGKFREFESGSATHGGGSPTSPEAQLKSDRSLAAQTARDDTMAESIFLAHRQYPGRRILHFTGAFHSDGFLGTVEQLRLRDPTLKIAVISPLEVEDPRAPAFAAEHRGDGTALLLVHPSPEDFAPDEDQSDFIRNIMAKRKADSCRYKPD